MNSEHTVTADLPAHSMKDVSCCTRQYGSVMEAYPCIRWPDEACRSKYSTSMTNALVRKRCRILFACLVPVIALSQQAGGHVVLVCTCKASVAITCPHPKCYLSIRGHQRADGQVGEVQGDCSKQLIFG